METHCHFIFRCLVLGIAVSALSPQSVGMVTASSVKPIPKQVQVNAPGVTVGPELGTWDVTVDLKKEQVQVRQVSGALGIKVAALLGAPSIVFSSPSSIYNNSVLVNAPFNSNANNPSYASLSLTVQILNQTGQPLGQASPTDATKISGVDLLLVPRSDCPTGTPTLAQPICVISNSSQKIPNLGASGRNNGFDPVYVAYMTPRDGSNLTVADDPSPPEWKEATAFTDPLNYARSVWRSDLRIPHGGTGTFGLRFRYAQDAVGNGKPRVTQFTYRMRVLADHPNGGSLVAGNTYVTTLAGKHEGGYTNGIGAVASFYDPMAVAVSPDGATLYVGNLNNPHIQAVNVATKVVTTLTTAVPLNPTGVAISPDGTTLYVSDGVNHRIRAINVATKNVTTLAGSGEDGSTDGIGTTASFSVPFGVAVSPDGNTVYVADLLNNRIRAINVTTKNVTTLAGSGAYAYADGIGTAASFSQPYGVAVSSDGATLYVSDALNNRIRAINVATKNVTTLAGSGAYAYTDGIGTAASFYYPYGVAISPDSTTLYVSDFVNRRIRAINVVTKVVTTVAGSGEGSGSAGAYAYADGIGTAASFNGSRELSVSRDGTTLYVADTGNNRIRSVHAIEGQTP